MHLRGLPAAALQWQYRSRINVNWTQVRQLLGIDSDAQFRHIQQLFSEADLNKTHTVNLKEFVALVSRLAHDREFSSVV